MKDLKRFVMTGAPGAGKSTVLKHLEARGFAIVPEAARTLIQERKAAGLPPRPAASEFSKQIYERDAAEYDRWSQHSGPVFFDRGIADSLAMLVESSQLRLDEAIIELKRRPISKTVFLFAHWPEIYTTDEQRDQSAEEAREVEARTRDWFGKLELELVEVPFGTPEHRAQYILDAALGSGYSSPSTDRSAPV